MEIKKSKKADLEKTRSTSMLIGYIVALAVMFAAFEWTTRDYVETEPVVYSAYAQMEEEIVPITQPIFTAAPPPPETDNDIVPLSPVKSNSIILKEFLRVSP